LTESNGIETFAMKLFELVEPSCGRDIPLLLGERWHEPVEGIPRGERDGMVVFNG